MQVNSSLHWGFRRTDGTQRTGTWKRKIGLTFSSWGGGGLLVLQGSHEHRDTCCKVMNSLEAR